LSEVLNIPINFVIASLLFSLSAKPQTMHHHTHSHATALDFDARLGFQCRCFYPP